MSAEALPVPVIPMARAGELADLDERLRAFSCPTGLHDMCSGLVEHEPKVHSGMVG